MDFLVWQTVPVGNACVLDALQDVEYDTWLLRGRSFRDTFPRTAFFRMSKRHRKDVRLTDDIWNLSDVKVCSPRLVEFLRKKDVPGLEFLPVTILDHRDKVASRDYCIVHCIALQDALDVKRSKPEYSPILPDEIDEVERLVVDASRVDPAAGVFRLAGFTTPVLVEKGLAQDMGRQKFVGPLFQPLDEWGT
jgi:hypothetical protein